MNRAWGLFKRYLERLLARMLPNMSAEYTRGCERLVTIHTFIWSFAAVNSHVFVQRRRLTERFAAHRALVRSMLLVHMQDVDAEAVALLERPRTQVAREFAVALVHAPRVFQVFVPVVFVGEHFAASVTCIPVLIYAPIRLIRGMRGVEILGAYFRWSPRRSHPSCL